MDAARSLYRVLGFDVYGYEKRALKVDDVDVDEEHRRERHAWTS